MSHLVSEWNWRVAPGGFKKPGHVVRQGVGRVATGEPLPTTMRRVKGVGRHRDRHYCQVCGLKHHLCGCQKS